MIKNFYLLRIEILGSNPLLWRKIYVPSHISLDRLHDVLQITMGWENQHLYDFVFDGKPYTILPEHEPDGDSVEVYRLNELVKEKGSVFEYVYDFGDNWIHQIVVEKIDYMPHEPEVIIKCLNGENGCPIENVGGIDKYIEFCEAMSDREHEMHEEYSAWYRKLYGLKDFDPDDFDRGKTNAELRKYAKWSRDRALRWKEL